MKRLSALQSRTSSPSRNRLDYGRFGRRFVFYVTLIVYLTGVLLSAFAWDLWSKSTGRDLLPVHDNLEVHPGKGFRRWPNPDIDAWPIPPTQYPCAGTYGRVTAETLEDTGLVGRLGLPPFSCKIGQ